MVEHRPTGTVTGPSIVGDAFTTRPVIMGRRGVITAGHYLATAAGMRMFERGGNAVDASVAAGLALAVLKPQDNGGDLPAGRPGARYRRALPPAGLGRHDGPVRRRGGGRAALRRRPPSRLAGRPRRLLSRAHRPRHRPLRRRDGGAGSLRPRTPRADHLRRPRRLLLAHRGARDRGLPRLSGL